MTPDFTILGAGGRIGRALAASLRPPARVQAIDRAGLAAFVASDHDAGDIISCIGLTGDFRTRKLETAEAHVGLTARILARGRFRSFLYLSSTRVYANAAGTHEDAPLTVSPSLASDLYNLTKLTGEALCLSDPRPAVRVARLSNVTQTEPDADTFLGQIVLEGQATGRVVLHQAPDSAKDYIARDDVVALLARIALSGGQRMYNVASGINVTHAVIAETLRASRGWDLRFAADAPLVRFPPIDISRIRQEFAHPLSDPLLPLRMMAEGQEALCSQSMRRAVA